MKTSALPPRRRLAAAVAAILAVATLAGTGPAASRDDAFDPLLSDVSAICGPASAGPPPVLRALVLAATKTETAPFQPAPMKAAEGDPTLYANLGTLAFKVSTKNVRAQAYVDQGMRLAFGFNHAEAQRAFRAAQKLDPNCAMCFWGEALVLGPNINVPMSPDANAPALEALAKAVALKDKAMPRERVLIEALEKRYAADAKADRVPLDAAYADAMKDVAARFPGDMTIATLAAEAAMDTQPWDYWEAGGVKAKGRGDYIVATLERVLKRETHAGAIHLYIHAVEASTTPERALPYANRLAALMPGAGHIVHMPAHIYYRVGMYRESLAINQRAIGVDERTSAPRRRIRSTSRRTTRTTSLRDGVRAGRRRREDRDGSGGQARRGDPDRGRQGVPDHAADQGLAVHDARAVLRSRHDPRASRAARRPRGRAHDVPLRTRGRLRREEGRGGRAARNRRDREARGDDRLQAVRRVEPAREGNHADGAPGRDRPARRCARRSREGRRGLRGRGLHAGHALVYRAAVLVLPGAPVARQRPSAPGQARRGREGVPRLALRTRNNGWALAGLAEVYKRKGDAKAEKAARAAYAKTWTGPTAPDLAKL
jgi:tetratricopeptide (TPR) repeat protein